MILLPHPVMLSGRDTTEDRRVRHCSRRVRSWETGYAGAGSAHEGQYVVPRPTVGISRRFVSTWVQRFPQERLAGLAGPTRRRPLGASPPPTLPEGRADMPAGRACPPQVEHG